MIYSIGYGNRNIVDFIELLKKYNIQYLIDVRSRPYSRFHPAFNTKALDKILSENNIRYVFLGKELGGRPEDESCYTDGRVDYTILSQTELYRQGIERLKIAYAKGHVVAIMCAELRPEECHRSRLIGETLARENILVQHIDEKGELENQATVGAKTSTRKVVTTLFGPSIAPAKKKRKKSR